MTDRTASRLALVVGTTSTGLLLIALALMYAGRGISLPESAASVTWSFANVLSVVVGLVGIGIGTLLAVKRPDNRIGWLFLTALAALALSTFGTAYAAHTSVVDPGSLPAVDAVMWLANCVGLVPVGMLAFIFLLFPTGRVRSPRWRPVARVMVGCFILTQVTVMTLATLSWSDPLGIASPSGSAALSVLFFLTFALPVVASMLLGVIAVVVRFIRSSGDERLQLKWFAAATVLMLVVFVPAFFSKSPTPPPTILVLQNVALVAIFGAIAVAVLKYRLYEIDVVISRTLIYGSLALFITAVYAAVVIGVGTLAGDRGSAALSAVAAGVIAVAFQPVHQRATRVANRLVYGKRATPYEILSDFSDRIAATYAVDDVLPRTARTVAEGMGVLRADVWVLVGHELRAAGAWPPATLEPVRLDGDGLVAVPGATWTVPVRYQGEMLGALSVQKAPGDPITSSEEKLLEDVASQAGLVLRNARLIEDLKASRQRLVAAQDEERRRLERNIHDGAQQQLVALAVTARLAQEVGAKDPERGRELMQRVQEGLGAALDDLRDLARGIYPPLLADKGLGAALEAQARKVTIPVRIEVDGIGRYRQETEAAVYFSVLEALQNITKYADASCADVRLSASDGTLEFAVSDDGRGFDASQTTYGTGLQGIVDRLAALDGTLQVRSAIGRGTTLVGRLPI